MAQEVSFKIYRKHKIFARGGQSLCSAILRVSSSENGLNTWVTGLINTDRETFVGSSLGQETFIDASFFRR